MMPRRPWEREGAIETKAQREPKTHREEMGTLSRPKHFCCTKKIFLYSERGDVALLVNHSVKEIRNVGERNI